MSKQQGQPQDDADAQFLHKNLLFAQPRIEIPAGSGGDDGRERTAQTEPAIKVKETRGERNGILLRSVKLEEWSQLFRSSRGTAC